MKRSFPEHVEFELTNACNLRCRMCPRSKMKRPVEDMPWTLFTSLVDECRGKVQSTYLHQFGEPLLYHDLVKAINYASEAGIHVSLSTNCTLLDHQAANEILASDLDEIVLCLDSLDPDTYESLRIGADFETVLENIKRFIRLRSGSKPRIVLQAIDMPLDKSQVPEYEKLGADFVLIKEYTNWAGMLPGRDLKDRFQCNKLERCLTIQSNGNAVRCCRDLDGVTSIGSVWSHSIQELWDAAEAVNPRTYFFCREC